MLEVQELTVVAQLIDNMIKTVDKLEEAFGEKDNNKFNESKKEILKYQNDIDKMIK